MIFFRTPELWKGIDQLKSSPGMCLFNCKIFEVISSGQIFKSHEQDPESLPTTAHWRLTYVNLQLRASKDGTNGIKMTTVTKMEKKLKTRRGGGNQVHLRSSVQLQ